MGTCTRVFLYISLKERLNLTSIILKVNGAHAWAKVSGILTSGMVGLPVTIDCDESWEGLTKNLVCRCSTWDDQDVETRTILNVGETATVAHEVMKAGMRLHLGIEGFREDGTLVIPTTWATCEGTIHRGANSNGDPGTDPELPIWNQLQAQIEQINREGITQERMEEIRSCAETAAHAATQAERSEQNAVAASHFSINNSNAAKSFADEAKASEENARASASSAANIANGALQAQRAAEAAAERAEAAAGLTQHLKPVQKSDDMTQPVGVDEDGRLWTAPTAGGGSVEEVEDILLGTLPMTISESNCYLLSETNATISTGEGAAQLVDFDANEPYIGDTTYNGGAFEKLGKNTIKVGFANVARNATVYFSVALEVGKTYTIAARIREKTADISDTASLPLVRVSAGSDIYAQAAPPVSGGYAFKSFDMRENAKFFVVLPSKAGYVAGETYATVEVSIYEGTHTEIPTGTAFDILAGEKYNTDGYMGATLSAVNGETVEVYKTNTAGAEGETDEGGVIFFGDSILHYSDVVSRYAAKTGKPVLNCAVGGTRMSSSRDSANAYYPVDMANIANAIASGDFSAQLNSSVATAGFTTLASANIVNYKAMILEFGTNDFSAKVPFDGTDATSIKGAIQHILRTILTKYPNMRIVVLSTLQYVTLGTGTESGVPTHDDGTVWAMNEVIKGVCESDEFCVPWVDMYHAFGQNGITRNTLNSDGVHLSSPNGAKRYADILVGKLNALGI